MAVASEYKKLKQIRDTLIGEQSEKKSDLLELISTLRSNTVAEMNLRDCKETTLPELWTLPKRLTIVISAKDYIQNLKDLQLATKDVEQATRELETIARNEMSNNDEFEKLLGVVCTSLSSCGSIESKTKPLPLELQGTSLENFAQELTNRLENCRKILSQSCDELVETQLKSCGWPPPFASPSDDPPNPNFWTVLISQNQEAFSKLESALIRLTRLQQAIDGRTINGKVLWFVRHLVVPLEDRLKIHFASEQTTTTDLSKPDWLFQTAVKIIQRHSMGMQYFQGVLQACQLVGLFDLEIEFMRCIQISVQSIIADFHLPRLFGVGSGGLWLTWAEAAKKFDLDVMEMIGITPEAGELWEQYLETGCIRVFFNCKDWLVAWCHSEVEDCMQQLDDVMLSPQAWDGPSKNGSCAFQEEIWPPRFSENAWGIFVSILQKTHGLPQDCVEVWLKRVSKPYLTDFGRRLSSTAESVEAYQELLEPNRASKICAVIGAAHYFTHNLTEWNEFENGSNLSRELLNHVLKKEINSFNSFRKKWCLRLAKEISLQFNTELIDYKKSLHNFRKLNVENTKEQTPSSLFVPTVLKLRELLEMFAGNADTVCFREIWKAVTYGIVRVMFNEVITETKFSSWGAHQLQCDVYTLMEVFSPYTNRPHTHFKELHEACLLLTMPKENADYIEGGIAGSNNHSREELSPEFRSYLEQCGLLTLETDQIVCILEERLNF